MSRDHAVALIGCAPLIRTLVEEQHLGLDRIKAIINVPGATYDAIRYVLNTVGISAPFDVSSVKALHEADVDDVATYFGDTLPEEADKTLRGCLGHLVAARSFGNPSLSLCSSASSHICSCSTTNS